jgi:hypothetical protein
MSPFRQVDVELGPPTVGLEDAALRAIVRLPRGGRLLSARSGMAAHVTGALGSAGVLAVSAAAAVSWATGWQPSATFCAAAVVSGGISLAAVLRAFDRTAGALTRPGDVVGRRAAALLRRMMRIAALVRHGRVSPGRAAALRRAIAAAADPDLDAWIPRDVVGRAELLLARLLAAAAGPGLFSESARREVHWLLEAAARDLDDAAPAEADLAALARAPFRRPRARFAERHERGHDSLREALAEAEASASPRLWRQG